MSSGQRRDERTGRLLEAALDLFARQGYVATTITEICRVAGVAPVQFYGSFSSRDALLERLYDDVAAATLAAVVEAVADAPAELQARSEAGVTAFCNFLLDDPRRARILSVEVVGVSATIEVRRRKALRAFADLLLAQYLILEADAADSRRYDRDRMSVVAMALVGGVNESVVDWLLRDDGRPRTVLIRALTDLVVVSARLHGRGGPRRTGPAPAGLPTPDRRTGEQADGAGQADDRADRARQVRESPSGPRKPGTGP